MERQQTNSISLSAILKISSAITFYCICLLPLSGTYAEIITFEDSWGEAGFNLVNQTASGVEIVFSVTRMNITDFNINDEIMQNVGIPGVFLPNDAGAPNLPGTGRFIAMPQGARAKMEVIEQRTEIFHDLNIVPAFEIPYESDDSPLRFEKNPKIYEVDAYYPVQPVRMGKPAKIRGVDVVILGICPFQYNPVTQELVVHRDIRVRIQFEGGNGHFGEDRLRSRWWEAILEQNLLNYQSLPSVDFNRVRQTDEDNVEYIIIVPDDQDFISWAETLKQWRSEQGIITGITTLTEIGGNDATLIENYIDNAYNNWDIPPVAVLLLSDYEDSGDLYGITSPTWNTYCTSDNIYADIDSDDLPDLTIARIPAQTPEHLEIMINKILDYEDTPPTDPGFYQHPVIAGAWEVSRWFILCCETIYGFFANELSKDPVREYAIYPGSTAPGAVWSTNVNTPIVVDYFGPEGLGYIPEDPTHLTDWGGNATRINNDLNSGAFVLQHRDHGEPTYWHTPDYTIDDMSGLTNENYPFVFSINCKTAIYSYQSEEVFSEAFHRYEYRALGIIGATQGSYSFVNDTFAWGIYDYMWPNFDPGYGSSGNLDLLPGFADASGKYYLEASSWPSNSGYKVVTYHLFHHFGGAFMTLYSEVPQNLTVNHADEALTGMGGFTVTADEGSLIALSVGGEVVGTAEGTGSPVSIALEPLTPGEVLRVTVTKMNYFRYCADVPIIDSGTPDLWVTLTPESPPIVIPATGGSFDYNIEVGNDDQYLAIADIWCDITMPGGSPYGPTMGPIFGYNLPGNSSTNRNRTQDVPGNSPAGIYTYNAYIGVYPDFNYDEDNFNFEKLTTGDGPWVSDWNNYGEPFEDWPAMEVETAIPISHTLSQNYPNPFNPLTTINYGLPNPAKVNLRIYDISGRLVATVLDGYRLSGYHSVTVDGSSLASGIYIARLQAEDVVLTRKMVLMK